MFSKQEMYSFKSKFVPPKNSISAENWFLKPRVIFPYHEIQNSQIESQSGHVTGVCGLKETSGNYLFV